MWACGRAGGADGGRAGLGCGLVLGQEGRRERGLDRVVGWFWGLEGRREGRLDRVMGWLPGKAPSTMQGRKWQGIPHMAGHPAHGRASRTGQGIPHRAGHPALGRALGDLVGVGGRCAVQCCVLCCVVCCAVLRRAGLCCAMLCCVVLCCAVCCAVLVLRELGWVVGLL